jgi:hypothetical protein
LTVDRYIQVSKLAIDGRINIGSKPDTALFCIQLLCYLMEALLAFLMTISINNLVKATFFGSVTVYRNICHESKYLGLKSKQNLLLPLKMLSRFVGEP